jgi:hypothetical protein
MAGVFMLSLTDKSAADRDFIQYWAAGQQLVHGANPYDASAILELERAMGLERSQAKVTFSPPTAFFVLVPLGLVSAKEGFIIWLLAQLAALSLSIWILWKVNDRPDSRYHLLGYLFAPALACLFIGQLGIFFLLSIVLFLYLHTTRPWLAGAVLFPCVAKPHLFVPFALALLLWVVYQKSYRLLGGFFAALAASCTLTLYFDPQIWQQYFRMMRAGESLDVFAPSMSAVFRLLGMVFLRGDAVWPQFVLEVIGCVWAPWYFWTRRARWNWMEQGMVVLLVSVACAPYVWFFDETILLPAVLAGLYHTIKSGRSLIPIALIAGIAAIEVFEGIEITTPFYIWTAPAWLLWYLYATGRLARRTASGAHSPK